MSKQRRKPRNRNKSNYWVKREVDRAMKAYQLERQNEVVETDPTFKNVTKSDIRLGHRNKTLTKKFGDHNNPWDRM